MNIIICSMGYTGYAVAGWRQLMLVQDINLKIYTPETQYNFTSDILEGMPISVFPDNEFCQNEFVERFVTRVVDDHPDTIIISGWSARPFKALVYDRRLASVRKLLTIDTMWEWNWRCLLSRWRLGSFIRHFDGVIVAGERGRMFARYIGFQPKQIFISTYGYDAMAFELCYEQRIASADGWPHRFAFVGRFAQVKGLDVLLEAYHRYRRWATTEKNSEPWQLHCFGTGSLACEMDNVEGVVNRGFLQPRDLPRALVEAGVLVLPSRRDPWGVALAEGAGAGLPLITSEEVSSSIDLVRHLYNGYVVPAGDVERLYQALCWMHSNEERLPEMGRHSLIYAGAYSPKVWAERFLDAVRAK